MSEITATENWFVATGQMPEAPEPDARQTAFYLGMQLEELAEKFCLVFGEDPLHLEMNRMAEKLKKGEYDDLVAKAMHKYPEDLLDGDMDLLWVSIGSARAQGAKVGGAYSEVIYKNWAKGLNGKFERHPETGKVIKPAGWTPPDLTPFIHPSHAKQKA